MCASYYANDDTCHASLCTQVQYRHKGRCPSALLVHSLLCLQVHSWISLLQTLGSWRMNQHVAMATHNTPSLTGLIWVCPHCSHVPRGRSRGILGCAWYDDSRARPLPSHSNYAIHKGNEVCRKPPGIKCTLFYPSALPCSK